MASRDRDHDSSSRRGTRSRRSRSISRSRSRSRSYSSRGGGAVGGGQFRRRAEDEDGNPHFSNYYRDRFGSESPQEYQNLRVTNIDPKVTNDELREALEKYLGRYGDLNVKIIRQMDPHERIAYVNFERVGDARNARHGCLQKLVDLLGRRLTVDPAGVIKDQEGRCVKATSTGAPGGRSPPPYSTAAREPYGYRGNSNRSDRDRDYTREDRADDYQRHYRGSNYRGSHASPRDHRNSHHQMDRPSSRRPNDFGTPPTSGGRGEWFSPRGPIDDSDEEAKATRTLFVGNLHMDVSKSDLQRTFSKHGVIEQIDIKTPHDGAAPYAFIRFQNLAMAQEARHYLIGNCGAWKIGYGKPMPSRRLWVGGLGPNTSLAWIEKEFDRFGAIEKIDYVRGENHAYILFASGEASAEAYNKMKGMQLKDGGERHLLQVDYADSSMYDGGGDDDRGQANFNHNGGRSHAVDGSDSGPGGGGGDKKSSSARRPVASPLSSNDRKRPMTPPLPPPSDSPPPKPKSSKGTALSTARSPRTPPLPVPSTTVSPPHSGSPSVQKSTPGAVSGVIISDGTVSSTTTSPPTSLCELSAQNLDELHQLRSPCWTGALVLKKSAYPIRLYKLAGDDDLIDAYLRNERGESVQLTVTQRLKLDQPKQDDVQKWLSSPSDQHAFLLAAANTNALAAQGNLADLQPRPLKLLVKYFKEKDAAGVVSVASNRRIVQQGPSPPQQQNGILYTFPRCPFADLLTSALCPKLAVMQQCGDDCLLVVLQKSAA